MGENQAATKCKLVGKWDFARQENFEEFLQANGANWFARKMASTSKPTVEVVQEGDKFTIRLITMVFTREEIFTIGTEFEKEQHSGDMMKVMPGWEGEKLVLKYTPAEGSSAQPQRVTREVVGDELITIMEVGDVVAKRVFSRAE